jgi:hypothetical protein
LSRSQSARIRLSRSGKLAKYRKRGGRFGVIEFWVENAFCSRS